MSTVTFFCHSQSVYFFIAEKNCTLKLVASQLHVLRSQLHMFHIFDCWLFTSNFQSAVFTLFLTTFHNIPWNPFNSEPRALCIQILVTHIFLTPSNRSYMAVTRLLAAPGLLQAIPLDCLHSSGGMAASLSLRFMALQICNISHSYIISALPSIIHSLFLCLYFPVGRV